MAADVAQGDIRYPHKPPGHEAKWRRNFRAFAALPAKSGSSGQFEMDTPLARARAKLDEIERQLRKHPDFHLYLLAKTEQDRMRMEAILIRIPAFGLWHKLHNSIALAAESPARYSASQLR